MLRGWALLFKKAYLLERLPTHCSWILIRTLRWVIILAMHRAPNQGSESFWYLPQDTQPWYMGEPVRTSDLTELPSPPLLGSNTQEGIASSRWAQGSPHGLGAGRGLTTPSLGAHRTDAHSTGQYMKVVMNYWLPYPDHGEGEGKVKTFPEGWAGVKGDMRTLPCVWPWSRLACGRWEKVW